MLATRKLWIGFAVSVLLLALFLVTVDLGRMLTALAGANYVYLAPGLALYLISLLFRTLRWHVMLRHLRVVPVRRLYPVVVVGYMANNLLPLRMGELVRSYYVGEREVISKTAALMTIFVERVFDAVVLLLFVAAIALFVPLSGLAEAFGDRLGIPWPWLVVLLSAPFVLALGALLLSAFFTDRARIVASVLIRPLPSRFEEPLYRLLDMLLVGLTSLRSPKTLALVFVLSVHVWLFEAGLFFLVGFSFGLNEVYDSLGDMAVASILVTSLANIGSSVPAAPGGIGLFELVSRETLVLLPLAPLDRAVAGGYAAVVHATLLLPMIVLGQVFLWTGHISLRSLSRSGRAARDEQAHPSRPQANR